MVASKTNGAKRSLTPFLLLLALFSLVLLSSACRSAGGTRPMTAANMVPPVLVLSPGDILDITFPGATNLNGMHRIGPEGQLSMPIIGVVEAAGKTAAQLESELEQKYATELRDTEIFVNVSGSAN